MRGKRAKQYRKLMQRYCTTFNFREPYQVLLDAEILQDAARFKMDLAKALERTLHGQIKPMVTQCTMRHLYNAKPANQDLIAEAQKFERRRCNHHLLDEPLSTLDCFDSVVDPKGSGTNKHRLAVASQDLQVRAKMRRKLGVPLIYIARSVMILEPMAAASEGQRETQERGKFLLGLKDQKQPVAVSSAEETAAQAAAEEKVPSPSLKRRRKGPSGPNPLSVKKAKTRHNEATKPRGEPRVQQTAR